MILASLNIETYREDNRLKKTCIILDNCHTAASSFYEIFKNLRAGKISPKKGAPTDQQQDLLRAMLLFSAAGLDAVVKQLIRDSLADVINCDSNASKKFESYVERKIRRQDGADESSKEGVTVNAKFLAKALISVNPKVILIEDMVVNLTGDSLQSEEQLLKAAEHFAIQKDQIIKSTDQLKTIFAIRNQITHEMDIDLQQKNRKRSHRKQNDMVKYVNSLLKISESFIKTVYEKMHKPSNPITSDRGRFIN